MKLLTLSALSLISCLSLGAPATAQADAIMNITVRRHVNSTDGNASARLAAATVLLKTADPTCADVACCVTLQQSGATTTFGTAGDGLDMITSEAELATVMAFASDVKVVISATNSCGIGGAWLGCASIGLPRNMVNIAGVDDCVWAHEFGHSQGLGHNDTCTDLIMRTTTPGTNDTVTPGECAALRANPDAVGPACGLGGGPVNDDCADALVIGDGVHAYDTTAANLSGVLASGLPAYVAGAPDTACQDFNGAPDDLFNDVWYLWSPGATDSYSLSTCDAVDYDSKLAIYTGACGARNALACNDDALGCSGFTSLVQVSGITCGSTYLIQVGGFSAADTGMGNLTISQDNPGVGACVTGDGCDSATVVTDGVHPFDTTFATPSGIMPSGLPAFLAGAPDTACEGFGSPDDLHNDVWFRWNADHTDSYSLSTCGDATYDTKLAIYSGNCASRTPLACNDDGVGCAGFSSRLLVTGIVCGLDYYVQVGGFSAIQVGTGNLTIAQDNPVPTDDCAGAAAIGDGVHAFDTTLAGHSDIVAVGLPPFVEGAPGTACESFAGQDPEALGKDVFFSWTADHTDAYTLATCDDAGYDTKLAIYSGDCGSPVALACNDDAVGCSAFSSTLNVTGIVCGQTYIVQVGGFASSSSGTGNLTISQDNPVAGDECLDALVITDGVHAFDTSAATSSTIQATGLPAYVAGFPDTECEDFGTTSPEVLNKDVFFRWTADHTDTYTLSSCGAASYDTKLAIYSGVCAGPTALACNDDTVGCSGFSSELTVTNITCGFTYIVQVGGFHSTSSGTGSLTISQDNPISNDGCSGATPVADGVHPFDTSTATSSAIQAIGLPGFVVGASNTACEDLNGEPENLHKDVFFSWTAGGFGPYSISTCSDASYDTKLAVYSGACGAPVALACNDDGPSCTGFTSDLHVSGIVSGMTYLVQVGGFTSSQAGTGNLTISKDAPSNYCVLSPNSAGPGATMGWSGSKSWFANNLILSASGGPPGQNGIFYYGPFQIQAPFGNGVRCVGGFTTRLNPPVLSSPGGVFTRALNFSAPPMSSLTGSLVVPGTTFNVQCWFRDPAAGGSGFNLSDGLSVTVNN